MVSSGSDYYEYGSTAKNLRFDVYKENKVLKNKRKKVKHTKLKLRIVLVMLLFFVCGMSMMYRYALITDLNYKINEAKKEYTTIKDNNLNIRVKIENSLDLSKVREIAENQYGMHKPQKEQIVAVNVPRNDYIKTNEKAVLNVFENKNIVVAGFFKIAKIAGLIK
jgi:cell division protein FtsB